MKIKHLLTKTLLVAAGLLLGGANSVWADEANLTPTADTYFSWDSGDTSYGTAETLYCGIFQEKWTDATPGLKDNGSKKIAVFKFDVSNYKGKITGATFKVTATNPSTNSNTRSIYLGYFDLTSWTESSTANNSGMNRRAASGLNIHPFGLSQSIAKGQTKEVSFSSDAFLTYLNEDEDGIVSLIIYGVGQECYVNSKEAASGKPSLTLTYTNETLYTATFNEGNSLNPTITIYSDAERTSPVTNGTLTDKTTYYYRATLEGYNNYESSFTVDGANPSVSFTMTAKTRYTFTVNAVDAGSNILKIIYTDADSYEGKIHTMVYPKYLTGTGNIVTYSKNDDTYGESKTAQAQNETYNVSYTAYDGVAYFVEVEDVVSATAYGSWNCSNGSAVRGFTDAKSIFTVPVTGVYDITYAACNNNVNYDMAVTLSKNETEIATKSDLKSVSINKIRTEGIVSNNNVSLASGDVLKLTPSTTNGILDYMLIELKSVPATISAAGWATLYTPYALDFSTLSTEIEAYTATLSSTTVTLNKVDNVPANTGVVLKKIGGTGSYDIPVIASSSTPKGDLTGNASADTPYDAGTNRYYLALNGESKAQFKKLTSGSIAAGKAFLETAVTAPVLNVVFGDDNMTGIADVRSKMEDVRGDIFDLQGRKVAQPTKGLYIQNGRKVILK